MTARSVAELEADASPIIDAPATRDIPLPSRSLRIGLGDVSADKLANVSTTEIPVTTAEFARVTETSRVAARSEDGPATGRHRIPAPTSALRARTTLVAIAAGAGAIAVTGAGLEQASTPSTTAAPAPSPALASSNDDLGTGIAASSPEADMSAFTSQLSQGSKIKRAKIAAAEAARKPETMSPLPFGSYNLTSAFAPRWGAFHGGLDMAAPLGTPIHAATDGVVKEAGPASGYGNWIQIKAADGTITMYGHMASSGVLVRPGQHVTAGDVIGLVGSEGFSTGPHVHFEVWKNGAMKIDPAVWLANRGVRLSALTS